MDRFVIKTAFVVNVVLLIAWWCSTSWHSSAPISQAKAQDNNYSTHVESGPGRYTQAHKVVVDGTTCVVADSYKGVAISCDWKPAEPVCPPGMLCPKGDTP